MSTETTPESRPGQVYEAGCHCGYIKFDVTLSPPLPENKVLNCNCSACRRFGYLLVWAIPPHAEKDPDREKVQWRGDSEARLSRYRFNTKQKDQLFCPKCGASIGIDFRDFFKPKFDGFGISVRTFNGIDLDTLEYEKLDGAQDIAPAGDLSGIWYDEGAETVTKTD
ncbi:hypothetical protein VPNG_04689 [Cytospora leucostoma]|uniref:CENP-V/GFA domain-containing protein n=1 Tax=Cytospora leucostoma TaxID=1230097 RepID=A0A423XAC6_9PEZI|nr:hypothetical protein VPNG_04689 [Cytospora leucostoma]